jgi:replicative DNA helicase
MSNERKILASAIKTREAFETLESHIREGDFTESARVVWDGLREFYSRDGEARSCDPEILVRDICRKLQSPKHRETFEQLIKDLSGSEVSSKNVVHDFIAVRRDAVGGRLASLLAGGRSGKDVEETLEEYKKWASADSLEDEEDTHQVLQGLPLSEITKTYSNEELIKVWPTALNNRLDGGVLRGHHMVVFARPEMGKTLFLVNAVAGFLSQNLTVLYVGNEDPIYDIALRVVCRLTKKDRYTVLANPEAADAEAQKLGYSNLVLASLAPGTPSEIEALVEEYKPDVILIDQLRNVAIGGKEGYVQQLEKAATAARRIAKRYNVFVVSVTQAGDSATGKAVLEMGDVDSSNTGIPAQADIMVGIGASQEDQAMGRRVISLPKNKRSGKHEYFPVRFDTQTSRIINVEEI